MKYILRCAIISSAFLVLGVFSFGQQFTLLKDINVGSHNSCLGYGRQPLTLTAANSQAFFFGPTPYLGPGGLWKTDGTSAGTVFVKEVSVIETMIYVNGLVFFSPLNEQQLWRSDGTETGTFVLLNSGGANLTDVNGDLFFTIANEIWRSDGTVAGTHLVKILSGPGNLTNVDGTLYFSESTGFPARHTLWKSDGTEAGTVMVKEALADISNLTNANGALYFIGNDGEHGQELWKSDGSEAGTAMIADIESGEGGSNIRSIVSINGNVYFFTNTTFSGNGLWKSDGTNLGTSLVKDLDDGVSPESLVSVNNLLFFSGYDEVNGIELWKSDGSEAGTSLVENIYQNGSSTPTNLININGTLFFSAISESTLPGYAVTCFVYQGALWKSDGTATGTVLVKNTNVGSNYSRPQRFVNANGTLFFTATDGLYGNEVWKSDGTSQGTTMVKDILVTKGSNPNKFTSMNGKAYFIANSGDIGPSFNYGTEVHQTDGTRSGTIQSTWVYSFGGEVKEFITHNGELFLSATNGSHGHELWKSNGLPLGAGSVSTMVKDINPNLLGGERASNPSHFTSVGTMLFFAANDGTNGNELWQTDGTSIGTAMVKNVNPNGNSNPSNLLNVNGVLYFTADNGTHGVELWKSNGTDAGTLMVKNISTTNNSNPYFLVNINGVLFFAADDGINGVELWKSDGTWDGTVMVKNIKAGFASSNPTALANINGIVFFAADDGINGTELWKSDGTDAGTLMIKNIRLGNAGSSPASITNLNGVAYFSADDGISARELWRSSGTDAGTVLVKDIWHGTNGGNPEILTKIGNNIFFSANNGVDGNEVWVCNAVNGARMISDIESGSESSNPTEFFEYGSKVLAAATKSTVGAEVWIADIPADIPTQLEATITAAGPLTICNGKSVNLQANTGTGYIYQWKRAGVNIAGAIQSSYTATLAGYYTVSITNGIGAFATSEITIVTVVNPPLATVAAAGTLTFCAGKNVLLKANIGTGYTYQWKKAGVNIDNATLSNYTATTAGAYSVVITNATGCSATSALTNVTVNPVPIANVAAASALTFCEGKTVQLKAITGTGYTYQWKRGATDIVGAISSNYTASATGFYTVIVTNASGCSATSPALAVVVKPLPAATITPAGPTTFCSGKNVLLKANTGTNYTYQWLRGATPITGASQVNYSATQVGFYSVIVTNSSGCSVTSAAIPISVNPMPVATITPGGPLTFCSGQNVLLRANTGTNYTYQWRKAGINIAGATQANYQATTSGACTVIVTNAAGCAVTSTAVTVTVNNAPVASVVAAGPTTFCTGKSVLLKATVGTGYTYQWKKNNVNIAAETTSNYTVTTAGNYLVVVSNVSGCSITSSVITVSATPAPVASVAATGPLTFCEGGNVLLKATVAPGYIYQWKKNGVNVPGQTQANYTATATGAYTVLVSNAEGCTTLSSNINVTVTPKPAAAITANGPLTFTQGGTVTLSVPTAAGNIYQWKKDGVNISGATTASYAATTSGSYSIAVTNTRGCQATSQPAVVTVTQTRPITKGLQEEEDIAVYPNPLYRNNYLNIDWKIAGDNAVSVTVYDMLGKKINSQRLLAGDRTVKIIGASGVYLVECRWGVNKRKIFRVVKVE